MAEVTQQEPGAVPRRLGRRDLVVGGTVAIAATVIVIGFATPSLRQHEAASTHGANTFSEDLRACRFLKGGPATQRSRVQASSPYVASCLRRRGWAPDGAPTLESVLQAND